MLILNKDLPSDTDEGYHATFGTSAPVVLTKVNQVNLMGRIPGEGFFSIVHILDHSSCSCYVFNSYYVLCLRV